MKGSERGSEEFWLLLEVNGLVVDEKSVSGVDFETNSGFKTL